MKRILLTGFSAIAFLSTGSIHTSGQTKSPSFQYVVTAGGSGHSELGAGLVWYASQFTGTGCAKIQNALSAANGAGWVFADLTGTIDCANGIKLSPGAWLYLPSNLHLNPLGGAGTGSGIYLSLGSHLICGGTNPSAGTLITAANGFNRPMIRIADAGHWTEVTNCRLEGNRAGQASATIAAAPTGASRTSNVATIKTTAAHGMHVNDTVYVDGVTDDLGFNGYWTVASVPTSTTFTYSNPGSNGTAGRGTITGATDGLYMYQVGENINIHHNYTENTSGSCYHIQGNMSPSGSAKSNACFDSGRYVFDFDGANGDFHIEDGSDDGSKGVFRFKQVTAYLKVTIDRMKNDSPAATVPNWMVMDGGAGHVYCKHCVIATGGSVNGADGILIKSPTSDGSAENYWEVELDDVEYVGGTGAGQINNIINSQGFLTVPYTQFNTNAGLATRIIHFYFGGEPWTSGYNGSGLLPEFVNILQNATVNGTTESPIMYSALTRLTSTSSGGACDTFNGMSAPAMEGHTLVVHNPYNCAWTINEEDVSQATPANRIRTGRGNVTLNGISWAAFTYLNPIEAVSDNGFIRSSNVVTVTLSNTVLYRVGDNVTISGATGCVKSLNGTFMVTSVPTNTTFTFSQTGGNETCGGAAATTSLPRWWLTGTYPASAAAITGAAVSVGNLPTCNASIRDQIRVVTDARAPAWNTTVVGGGTVRIPVYCNGTHWIGF